MLWILFLANCYHVVFAKMRSICNHLIPVQENLYGKNGLFWLVCCLLSKNKLHADWPFLLNWKPFCRLQIITKRLSETFWLSFAWDWTFFSFSVPLEILHSRAVAKRLFYLELLFLPHLAYSYQSYFHRPFQHQFLTHRFFDCLFFPFIPM